jgi:hypothetical protein
MRRVNLEAFRKRGYAVFDIPPDPYPNDPVETKSFFDIYAVDAGVRVNAPQERGVKHVWQANIGNVQAGSSYEATRFMRLDAAADESRRCFRHQRCLLWIIFRDKRTVTMKK